MKQPYMRDSRDVVGQRSVSSTQSETETEKQGRNMTRLGQTVLPIAQGAVTKLQEYRSLDEEDKANIEAIQAGEERVQTEQMNEGVTGVSRFLGKQSNRMKYAEEIAARNKASNFLNGEGAIVDQYANKDTKTYLDDVSVRFEANLTETYGDNTKSIARARKEFNRALPKLSAKHAPQHASYLQQQVWDGNVTQYAEHITDIQQTVTGNTMYEDKAGAMADAQTFFDDTYIVGEKNEWSIESSRLQKAEALRQQVASGNTFMYEQATQSGFMKRIDPKAVKAIEAAKDDAIAETKTMYAVDAQTAINDALEQGNVKPLMEAQERLSGMAERGFDTEEEKLTEQNLRARLLTTTASLMKVDAKAKVDDLIARQLIELRDQPTAVGALGANKKQQQLAGKYNNRIIVDAWLKGQGVQTDQLTDKQVIDFVVQNPNLLQQSYKEADKMGEQDPAVNEALERMFATPENFFDDNQMQSDGSTVAGMSDRGQRTLVSFASMESKDPATFSRMLGQENLAKYTIIKNGAGKTGAAVQQDLNNYQLRKDNPTGLNQLGVDTKMSKNEWVAQQIGLKGAVSPAVKQYYTDVFNTGYAVSGSVDGALKWTKRYGNSVDKPVRGINVRNGALYETLQGIKIDDVANVINVPIDTQGNTYFSDLVQSVTTGNSNIRTMKDIPDLEITADPLSGDMILSSSQFQSVIVIPGEDVQGGMQAAEELREKFDANEAKVRAQRKFTNMHYMYGDVGGGIKPVVYGNDVDIQGIDTSQGSLGNAIGRGWDSFLEAVGYKQGTEALTNLGIIPTVEAATLDDIKYLDDGAEPNDAELAVELAVEAEVSPYMSPDDKLTDVLLANGGELPTDVRTEDVVDEYGRVRRSDEFIRTRTQVALKRFGINESTQQELLAITPEALNIIRHEGYSNKVYTDYKGKPTWGFGFLLEKPELDTGKWVVGETQPTKESAIERLEAELIDADRAAKSWLADAGIDAPSDELVGIITNMAYNHGEHKLDKYIGMQSALRAGDANKALHEMRDSAWWRSYGGKAKNGDYKMDRANELLDRLERELLKQGNWKWDN